VKKITWKNTLRGRRGEGRVRGILHSLLLVRRLKDDLG